MNRIKQLRDDISLLQKDLAQELNVKPNTVSSWESGRTEPDFSSLRKMSEIFGCSIDYILGGSQKEAPTVVDGERVLLDVTDLTPENRQRFEDYLRLLLMSQDK